MRKSDQLFFDSTKLVLSTLALNLIFHDVCDLNLKKSDQTYVKTIVVCKYITEVFSSVYVSKSVQKQWKYIDGIMSMLLLIWWFWWICHSQIEYHVFFLVVYSGYFAKIVSEKWALSWIPNTHAFLSWKVCLMLVKT